MSAGCWAGHFLIHKTRNQIVFLTNVCGGLLFVFVVFIVTANTSVQKLKLLYLCKTKKAFPCRFLKNIMNSVSRWSAKEANLDIGWIDFAHGQGSDFLWSWQQFQDVNMWSHTNRFKRHWAAGRKFNFSFTLSAHQIIANTRAVTKEVKDIEQTNADDASIQIERCQPWRSQDPLSWGEQEKIHQIMEPHSLRPRQVQQTLYYQMARRVLPNF